MKTAMYRIRTDTTCRQIFMYLFEVLATHLSFRAFEVPVLLWCLFPACNPRPMCE